MPPKSVIKYPGSTRVDPRGVIVYTEQGVCSLKRIPNFKRRKKALKTGQK
jgi:hypothetical protein